MATIDERLINPTPQTLSSTLLRAVRSANGRVKQNRLEKDLAFWQRFIKRAMKTPEGNQIWYGRRGAWGTALVRAAWWTDPVGRRHWRLVGRRADYWDHQLSTFAFANHPLWHVYPERLALRSLGSQPPELLAVCDCGVTGPVESLAWMGECCGPCHDRTEEGSPLPPRVFFGRSGLRHWVSRLAFAGPDQLISASNDRILRWDLRSGESEELLHRKGGSIQAMAASFTGWIATSTAMSRVLLRHSDDREWRTISVRCGHIGALAFSPDGRWLAIAGTTTHLLDLHSTDLSERQVFEGRCIGPLGFSQDSRYLWALDMGADLYRADVYSGQAVQVRARPESTPEALDDFLAGLDYYPFNRALACSASGRWVAVVASWDDWFGIHVGDLATGRWMSLQPPQGVTSLGLVFTRNGLLASTDSDGGIRLWDPVRQVLLGAVFADPHPPGYRQLAAILDDQAAVAQCDGSIRVVPWQEMLRS